MDRRRFLGAATASAAALAGPPAARAIDDPPRPDGRPPVTDARATSSDAPHGPALLDRLALIIVAAGRTGGDVPLGVAGHSPGG